MTTGSAADIVQRVKRLIPNRWFSYVAPSRDAVLGGLADLSAWCYTLIGYARAQGRIATAYGIWLDIIAYDYLGRFLIRDGAGDDAFRAVIRSTILQERVTRAGMINALTTLTGRVPWVFEPWNTYDTGAYSGSRALGQPQYGSMGYGVGRGGYGSMGLPAQTFVHVYRSAGSGIPGVGGYYNSVAGVGNDQFTKVLLHFDGGNGATVISDTNAGGSAHIWGVSPVGATTSTTQSKFGGGSLLGNASSSVKTPANADFMLDGKDFTIDFWFYTTGAGTNRFLCGQNDVTDSTVGSSFLIYQGADNALHGQIYIGGTVIQVDGATAVTAAGWNHATLVRRGNIANIFLNGIKDSADVACIGSVNTSLASLGVACGGDYPAARFAGYMDEFRLSIGIARWTANFTPPVKSYEYNGGVSPGGYGVGSVEYAGPLTELSGITDTKIYQLISMTKPTGSTCWVAIG